mmetsp:Transcript_39332/g.121625  ORF Transcript_39332/g.121625 Transcript_39332/m.121625 type:complete len:261 (-) Transcript_39332:815-1597(-)
MHSGNCEHLKPPQIVSFQKDLAPKTRSGSCSPLTCRVHQKQLHPDCARGSALHRCVSRSQTAPSRKRQRFPRGRAGPSKTHAFASPSVLTVSTGRWLPWRIPRGHALCSPSGESRRPRYCRKAGTPRSTPRSTTLWVKWFTGRHEGRSTLFASEPRLMRRPRVVPRPMCRGPVRVAVRRIAPKCLPMQTGMRQSTRDPVSLRHARPQREAGWRAFRPLASASGSAFQLSQTVASVRLLSGTSSHKLSGGHTTCRFKPNHT